MCIENSSSSLSLPASFPFKQICIFTRLPHCFSQENSGTLLYCCAQVPNENVCKWVIVKKSGLRSKRVLWGSLPCINKGLLPFWLAQGRVDRVQSSVARLGKELLKILCLHAFDECMKLALHHKPFEQRVLIVCVTVVNCADCVVWTFDNMIILVLTPFAKVLLIELDIRWRLFAAVSWNACFTLTLSARRLLCRASDFCLPGWADQQGVAALFAFQPPSGLFHTNGSSIFPDRVHLRPHLLIPSVCLWCWCRGANLPSSIISWPLLLSRQTVHSLCKCAICFTFGSGRDMVSGTGAVPSWEVVPMNKDTDGGGLPCT